jgi:hypothetical protein
MVINTNIQAQMASDTLAATQSRLSKSLARLSSGSKIVQSADDAGGLAVSSRMDAQINGWMPPRAMSATPSVSCRPRMATSRALAKPWIA